MKRNQCRQALDRRPSLTAIGAVSIIAAVLLAPVPVLGAARTAKAAAMTFQTSTPTRQQTLEVTPAGKKTISFKLTLAGPCQRTVTGRARYQHSEMDADDDHRGFFIDEFLHREKNGCELRLRIEFKSARRARVEQAGSCQPACSLLEDIMTRSDGAAEGGK